MYYQIFIKFLNVLDDNGVVPIILFYWNAGISDMKNVQVSDIV